MFWLVREVVMIFQTYWWGRAPPYLSSGVYGALPHHHTNQASPLRQKRFEIGQMGRPPLLFFLIGELAAATLPAKLFLG